MSDQIVPREVEPLMCAAPVGDGSRVLLNLSVPTHKIQLRGKTADAAFLSGFEKATNLPLPCQPNTVNRDGVREVCWLGPDEWLIRLNREGYEVSGETTAQDQVRSLQNSLERIHSAVVDVSDYYCVFELSGPRALEVLEKVTPLDVPGVLSDTGSCAQTRMGTAAVLLNRSSDSLIYQIQVRRSFAEYLWEYISDAAVEFLEFDQVPST